MTKEQLKTLEPYEQHFTTAIRSRYARYPGSHALQEIHQVYSEVSKNSLPLNTSCSSCVFRLLVDCGTIYFKDKQELEQIQEEVKPKRTRKKS